MSLGTMSQNHLLNLLPRLGVFDGSTCSEDESIFRLLYKYQGNCDQFQERFPYNLREIIRDIPICLITKYNHSSMPKSIRTISKYPPPRHPPGVGPFFFSCHPNRMSEHRRGEAEGAEKTGARGLPGRVPQAHISKRHEF